MLKCSWALSAALALHTVFWFFIVIVDFVRSSIVSVTIVFCYISYTGDKRDDTRPWWRQWVGNVIHGVLQHIRHQSLAICHWSLWQSQGQQPYNVQCLRFKTCLHSSLLYMAQNPLQIAVTEFALMPFRRVFRAWCGRRRPDEVEW